MDRLKEHGVMFFTLAGAVKAVLIIAFTGAIAWFMGYVNEKCANGSIISSWIIRAYENKCQNPRKVPKAAVFPQNIQNPKYTPHKNIPPNIHNILEYKQAKSMADTMGFAFAAFFSGGVIISPSPTKYEFSMKFSK